jgi:hypothetical protein
VGAHQIEEGRGVGHEAGGDVSFHVGEHGILLARRKLDEGRAFRSLCVNVDGGETCRVGIARGTQRTRERPIDVMRRAGFRGARAILVRWDQAYADRLQDIGLSGGEGLKRFKLRRSRRVNLRHRGAGR